MVRQMNGTKKRMIKMNNYADLEKFVKEGTVISNSKVVLLCGSFINFGYEDLEQYRREQLGENDSRPVIAIQYISNYNYPINKDSVKNMGANQILDLTTEAPTLVERELSGLSGKRFNRKTMTKDLDAMMEKHDSMPGEEQFAFYTNFFEQYEYDNEDSSKRDLGADLAHGVSQKKNLRIMNGFDSQISMMNGIDRVVATEGPSSVFFEQYRCLNDFYDFCLGQHLNPDKRGPHFNKMYGHYEWFEQAKTMEEADKNAGYIGKWEALKKSLSYSGITTLEQIKDRVKEFEENFFPGEFEKAAVTIRATREWLQSLKD